MKRNNQLGRLPGEIEISDFVDCADIVSKDIFSDSHQTVFFIANQHGCIDPAYVEKFIEHQKNVYHTLKRLNELYNLESLGLELGGVPVCDVRTTPAYSRNLSQISEYFDIENEDEMLTKIFEDTGEVRSGSIFAMMNENIPAYIVDDIRSREMELLRRFSQVTNEYLELMNELYTSESPAFNGNYFNISDISFNPKPLQKPHPPIWVGGSSKNALKRAVKYGNGWHAVGYTPQEIKDKKEELKDLFAEYNKTDNNFIISVRKNLQITSREVSEEKETLRGNIDKISNGIDAYKNAGVNYLVFQILSSDLEGVIGTMRTFSKEVIIKSESFSNISKA